MNRPAHSPHARAGLALLCLAMAHSGHAGTSAAACADDPPRSGTWYLVGHDSRHWRAEMVLQRQAGARYDGHMTWRAVQGSPAGGLEPFSGEYDAATCTLTLRGEPVREATGDIASGAHYSARVADEGRYLAYGRWWGVDVAPGTWAARLRTGSD